jgi:chemotaxis protein methyltransferase CheR
MTAAELTEPEFEKFRALIYRAAGIQIPATKRLMMSNRVRRRLRATGIATFAAYLAFLTAPEGRDEIPLFLDEITTNETYFFRDPDHYRWFGDVFLPAVVQQARRHERPRSLRVWSAACATGEELYSAAAKIWAHRAALGGWKITLLGTDLSGAALAAARAGRYDARALRLVSDREKATLFDADAEAQRWTVKPEVRALATWKSHNLLQPLREPAFDCIFLKNVLIYFDTESKRVVVRNVLDALAAGGYLVVGPTEGIYTMLGALTRHTTWLYQRPA